MKLKKWLKNQNITNKDFAKEIGVSRSQIHKYINEGAIPKREVILKIFKATDQEVTVNDFHGIVLSLASPEIQPQETQYENYYEDYKNAED